MLCGRFLIIVRVYEKKFNCKITGRFLYLLLAIVSKLGYQPLVPVQELYSSTVCTIITNYTIH